MLSGRHVKNRFWHSMWEMKGRRDYNKRRYEEVIKTKKISSLLTRRAVIACRSKRELYAK
jgi:hypothetical protein